MKKLYSYILISLAILVVLSCETEDRLPDFQEAATLRLQFPDPEFTLFNFEDLDNAMLLFDMFTVNRNIDSVNLYITYYSFAQDSTYDEEMIRTYDQSDFNAQGAIRNIQITPSDVATQFGISRDLITGGDRMDIRTQVVLEDGRRFPNDVILPGDTISNVHPGIRAVSTSSFNTGFTAYVACPLPPNFGVGTYQVEQISGPADPIFGEPSRWLTEEVNVSASSPIGRTFEGTYFTFDGIEFSYLLVCENILVPVAGAGLGCGAPGGLAWGSAPSPSTFSVESDDEFLIQILDNVNADCGMDPNDPLTLRLRRVD